MTTAIRAIAILPFLAHVACLDDTAVLERRLERSFDVTPGGTVRVELSGGRVTVLTGEAGRVHASIEQQIFTDRGESEANRMLADYHVTASQNGNDVAVLGRRKNVVSWLRWGPERVQLSATLTAPPDTRLELVTSGGSVTVRGERVAPVRAGTSGGSVTLDGGPGPLVLTTSGGSIRVGRALGRLSADTSGGSVSIDYVGARAEDVVLSTSGGSIRIGVDPAASLAIDAGTSGGSVRLQDLPFDAVAQGRSHVKGTMNGGLYRLRASTSGGSIDIRPASDPGGIVRQRASR